MNQILEKKYLVDGLSIDTRSIKKDNLFLAIKERESDINKFNNLALKKDTLFFFFFFLFLKKKNKRIIKVKNSISF